jgi:metal-sulfur cluster biosynthetic enzyme
MRSPIDIWRMGLVDELDIEGGHVCVVLCLTVPGCVHLTAMRQFITDVLLELDGVESVEVSQTRHALWTPDRMRSA